jgi:hypothetical protein
MNAQGKPAHDTAQNKRKIKTAAPIALPFR